MNTNQLSELAAESDLQELTEEDMAKQLNPNAVEFVPTSPSHSPTNPDIFIMNGDTGRKSFLPNLNDDVIAQSPRKAVPMDNIALPSENEFETEFSQRPSELKNETHRSESSCSQASYQEMNLKEAMHGDEKQEYAPEEEISVNIDISHTLDTLQTGGDVMNTSFYNINPNDLNAVQPLPDDIIDDESIVETVSKIFFLNIFFGISYFYSFFGIYRMVNLNKFLMKETLMIYCKYRVVYHQMQLNLIRIK